MKSNFLFICFINQANKECAKIPSWMKSDLARSDLDNPNMDRIVNGKTAPSPIPWQVHLRQGSPTGSFGYFCGGTIIDAKTILTAAHCYDGMNLTADDLFVTAGVVNIQTDPGQRQYGTLLRLIVQDIVPRPVIVQVNQGTISFGK